MREICTKKEIYGLEWISRQVSPFEPRGIGEQGHREYNAGAMRPFVLLAIPRSGLANKSKARRGVARRRSQPRGVKGLRVLQ
jgi:hypothetical protein